MDHQNTVHSCVVIVLVIILHSVCFTVKKEAELGRKADELAYVNPEGFVKKDWI